MRLKRESPCLVLRFMPINKIGKLKNISLNLVSDVTNFFDEICHTSRWLIYENIVTRYP